MSIVWNREVAAKQGYYANSDACAVGTKVSGSWDQGNWLLLPGAHLSGVNETKDTLVYSRIPLNSHS